MGGMTKAFGGLNNSVAKLVGTFTGATQQADAAEKAAQLGYESTQQAGALQKDFFQQMSDMISPYRQAGEQAINAQGALVGLQGTGAQSQAISAIENSPAFQAIAQQGENAILQNAAATGGLRGGNTQLALSKFRPELLNLFVQQQLQNLGGFTSLGQNSAVMTGNAGMNTAGNLGTLLQQGASALGGGVMAQGGLARTVFGDALNMAGSVMGGGGRMGF